MNPAIMQLVISFIERQFIKWVKTQGQQLDWEKVKADAQQRIAALLPGEIFDAAAKTLTGEMVDLVAAYLSSNNLAQTEDNIKAALAHASDYANLLKAVVGKYAPKNA